MRRAWYFIPLFLMLMIFPLAAQEDDSEPEYEVPEIVWDTYVPDLYRTGDSIISITAGTTIPTIFTGVNMDGKIDLGVMGALAYSYFLTPNLFIGGELRGMFAGTYGKSMIYIVPIGPFIGWQFTAGRFEFPLRFMTGIAPQTHGQQGYFGWVINPGASVFFRYSADWSFGLNAQWWMLPQWPKTGDENMRNFVLGNFLEISLTARYHFK